jgi:hypothetical protein
MVVLFTCPKCHHPMDASSDVNGEFLSCPNCKSRMAIPAAAPPVPPPIPTTPAVILPNAVTPPALKTVKARPAAGRTDHPLLDVLFRTGACVAVGIIGFWYPIWLGREFDGSEDSRMGVVFLVSLPAILGFAILATGDITRNAMQACGPRRGLGRALAGVALVLCWAPILYLGYAILRVVIMLLGLAKA